MQGDSAKPGLTCADPVTVKSVPAQGALLVCFCGHYDGLLKHWNKKQCFPCGGDEACNPLWHKHAACWQGYAPVRVWNAEGKNWTAFALEITECLEEQLRGRRLAGEVWLLTRDPSKGTKGAVGGQLLETRKEELLIADFDFRAAVARRYHTTAIKWGVVNPLTPRIRLVPVDAPPPAAFVEAFKPEVLATPEQIHAAFGNRGPRIRPDANYPPLGSNGHEKR